MNLKNDCSVGCDNISNKIIKHFKHFIIPPLTHIFNTCFTQGIFPKSLKKSVIHPIFKKGDRNQIDNYRPISILPSLSKILEKLMNGRLVRFLEDNQLISNNQYGFRTGKSAETAVQDLVNFVVENLDKGIKTIGIFLDLAKAFDTISIPLLLAKMDRLGIRGIQLKLFADYLSDRKQSVKIGEHISNELPIRYGVPQGSILGPVLFLIYINDLLVQPFCNKIISYADDTVVMFSENTWEKVYHSAQTGLNMVTQWLRMNYLTINVDKSIYIPFSITSFKQPSTALILTNHDCVNNLDHSNCVPLKRASTVKYLGVILDFQLNFYSHIELLCSRVRKLIYIFKNLRHVADSAIMKQVYISLCQSILTYCILSWGGAPKTIILNLERAQRAVLKTCIYKSMSFPTKNLYEYCDVLTVRQLFIYHVIIKQHTKIKIDPKQMTKRRKVNMCPPVAYSHSFTRKYAYYLGPYLYNKINDKINIYIYETYKCKIKIYEYLKTLTYTDTENLLKVQI